MQNLLSIFLDKKRWSNPATYVSLVGFLLLLAKALGYDLDESTKQSILDAVQVGAGAIITLIGIFADLKSKGFKDNQ